MGRNFTLVACSTFLCCLFLSCNKEDFAVERPVYFSIPGFELQDDVSQNGSNHSLITTAWVTRGNSSVGAFELPETFPVILEDGVNEIKIFPGINLNGISSSRAINEFFEPLDTNIRKPENQDTIFFPVLKTRYTANATVRVLENFDGPGLAFEPTSVSDTSLQKISDSAQVFHFPGEKNGKAGALFTTNARDRAEVATSDYFELPQGGANVYVELTYRGNIPFAVGVIGNTPSGIVKQPTVIVNAKENWNKIYINLVTEVSSILGTDRFKIYLSALHQKDIGKGEIYLDNIKLVY